MRFFRAFLNSFGITARIIIVNVAFFFLVSIFLAFKPELISYAAIKPSFIVQGKNLWTLLTGMFMHANFFHLFFNMFSLFFIGSFVEKVIGRKRFFWLYMISGLFSGLVFSLLAGFFGFGIGERIFGSPDIIGVGASGAIFGLAGLLAVLVPHMKVYLIAGPLLAIILQAIFSNFISGNLLFIIEMLASVYIFVSILAVFSFNPRIRKFAFPIEMSFWLLPIIAIFPLVVIGLFVRLPIGNTAHFAGLLAGLAYGLYLKKKYKRKVFLLRRMFGK